ncbi:MAG: winged helix DNA-binding domain-containing protein [Chloroflexota bacterium]|nr:winged helix DNA-binding domain-containing protein [Chloroflexota bacterium]
MPPQTLSLRQLNRTLLARQLLLERQRLDPKTAIEILLALQSQIPNPPYIGLWTRLHGFDKSQLTAALEARAVVRAPWLRSTLHLVSAADHQRFQAVIQPALARGLRSFFGARARGLNVERLVEIAKPYLEAEQPSIGALRDKLQAFEPGEDKQAMAYAVRSYLPLVQVPPSGAWGLGTRATYTTAASWLGPAAPADLSAFFRRYLAAFGPADVMDFQTWTGMTRLKPRLSATLEELVCYQTADGKRLYDLPDQAIIDEDVAPPIRFLPEYDNILIAHKDRSRILPEAQRKKVFVSAGRVLGSVLIDGFVGAIWKVERERTRATLRVTLFEEGASGCLDAIEGEGLRLLRFIDEGALDHCVEFAPDGRARSMP